LDTRTSRKILDAEHRGHHAFLNALDIAQESHSNSQDIPQIWKSQDIARNPQLCSQVNARN
jgi:hypothetical protein